MNEETSEEDELSTTTLASPTLKEKTSNKMCPICQKEVPGTGNLSFHLMLHPSDKLYACEYCIKVFRTQEEVSEHYEAEHVQETKKNECEHCGKKFHNSSNLKRHLLKHTKETPYKCAYCDEQFSCYNYWRQHEVLHQYSANFKCQNCGVGFQKQEDYLKHCSKDQCTLQTFQCCDITFSKRIEYITHCQKKHRKAKCEGFPCQYCGRMFAYPSQKKRHELQECNRTKLTVKSQTNSQGAVEYMCEFCDRKFPNRKSMLVHRSCKHINVRPENQRYSCNVCGKKLASYSSMYYHRLRHEAVKPHVCEICSKSFITKSLLNTHMRKHTKEKPYTCQYCGKKFPYTDTLKAHERIHTGEKPYKCKVCGESFTQWWTKRTHEKTHFEPAIPAPAPPPPPLPPPLPPVSMSQQQQQQPVIQSHIQQQQQQQPHPHILPQISNIPNHLVRHPQHIPRLTNRLLPQQRLHPQQQQQQQQQHPSHHHPQQQQQQPLPQPPPQVLPLQQELTLDPSMCRVPISDQYRPQLPIPTNSCRFGRTQPVIDPNIPHLQPSNTMEGQHWEPPVEVSTDNEGNIYFHYQM